MLNVVFKSAENKELNDKSELIVLRNILGEIYIEITSENGGYEGIRLHTDTATALVKHLKSEIKKAKKEVNNV